MRIPEELSLAGLAAKAGKVVSGEFATYYQVPFYIIGSKEELGRSIGKEYRASLALTDENFSRAVINKIEKTRHEQ